MSYFEYFIKNIKNSDAIYGTCYSMCPQEEETRRVKEKRVHVLEMVGWERRLVKSYSRPAADTVVAVPALLRPFPVLYHTVGYLLMEVLHRQDVLSPVVYAFVSDRLRAVRQDMTVQRLAPSQCARLLEPMVRFYLYYGYKLCELPLKDYDPVLNEKHLLECLKWFLSSCDAIGSSNPRDVEDLTRTLSGLDISQRRNDLTCDRVLMETLYILCNLDDVYPLRRYLSLPKDLKRDPRLELAYSVSIANQRGEFLRVTRAIDRLCALGRCAVYLHLPILQRRGVEVLSHAYSSKTLSVPVEVLCRWLRFGNVAHAAAACDHYGVAIDGNVARFDKNRLKRDAVTMQPKKVLELRDEFELTVDHVFTY